MITLFIIACAIVVTYYVYRKDKNTDDVIVCLAGWGLLLIICLYIFLIVEENSFQVQVVNDTIPITTIQPVNDGFIINNDYVEFGNIKIIKGPENVLKHISNRVETLIFTPFIRTLSTETILELKDTVSFTN